MTANEAGGKLEEHDEETGELTQTFTALNSETGEVETVTLPIPPRPKKFKILLEKKPKKYVKVGDLPAAFSPAITYLLPTLIFFYPTFWVICLMLEVVLHIWAHRKNKKLGDTNSGFKYQSPLHITSKEFCSICKDEDSKMKISKMQEKMHDKFKRYSLEYVKRIV